MGRGHEEGHSQGGAGGQGCRAPGAGLPSARRLCVAGGGRVRRGAGGAWLAEARSGGAQAWLAEARSVQLLHGGAGHRASFIFT